MIQVQLLGALGQLHAALRIAAIEWMEKVSDVQYGAPLRAPGRGTDAGASLGLSKRDRDFAPKLAELTDNVLYGDIWERPELSKRDRSLVTVAALIALNRQTSSGLTSSGRAKMA